MANSTRKTRTRTHTVEHGLELGGGVRAGSVRAGSVREGAGGGGRGRPRGGASGDGASRDAAEDDRREAALAVALALAEVRPVGPNETRRELAPKEI